MNKAQNKKRLRNVIIVSAIAIVLIYLFVFLCSIRFRVQYLFHFSVDTHDYVDFDEHKNNFEKLIDHIDAIVEKDPDFFGKYEEYCTTDDTGIIFYDKSLSFPDNKVLFEVKSSDWEKTRMCLYTFPDRGYGEISFHLEYPEYVFFKSKEYTPRFFVYTRGGRPSKKLLDEYWGEYEFVKVVKLSCGWYDIRPIGKK